MKPKSLAIRVQCLPHQRADRLSIETKRRCHSDRQVAELALAGPAEDGEVDQVQGTQDTLPAAPLGMAVLDVELQAGRACGRYIDGPLAGGQNQRFGRLPGARKEADQLTGCDANSGGIWAGVAGSAGWMASKSTQRSTIAPTSISRPAGSMNHNDPRSAGRPSVPGTISW